MNNEYEVIFCIVNQGFSDSVMMAARSRGARGGTVLNARGTARQEAEKAYGIVIDPEKEIILILITKDIKEPVLHAIYQQVGLNTPGQGILFTLPVDDVMGITPFNNTENIEK